MPISQPMVLAHELRSAHQYQSYQLRALQSASQQGTLWEWGLPTDSPGT